MFTRKKVAAAGVIAALAGALVVGGLNGPLAPALAAPSDGSADSATVRQTPPDPAPKPGQGPGSRQPMTPERRQQLQQQRQQAHQLFLDRVAANLGVSSQQLRDALQKTQIERVNQAVAEGKLSQDQANRLIQRINSGQGPLRFGPHFGAPGQGPKPGSPGARGALRGGMAGAAQALGITPEQLAQELRAGRSLAQIAEQQGISRDELKNRLQTLTKQRLDQAVQQGRMTQEQANQVLTRFTANLDHMLDASPGRRRGSTGGAGR